MSGAPQQAVPVAPGSLAEERPIGIPHGGEYLTGSVGTLRSPRAVVLIANDRGYARHVPALRALAAELRRAGFATLMADVARDGEECIGRDLNAVAGRLASALAWLATSKLAGLQVVIFGMGAAAPMALLCAVARPSVAAAIACGPHPDAAGVVLGMVSCPTLLIAHAGRFGDVASHVRALGRLVGRRELEVLPDPENSAKGAVDVARAATRFLSFIGREKRKAA